ncbi:hypothetical protein [Rufibacter roseus]|uniref:Uncharacterized protein n=1 Tax=Rufibacter roseus TaxID=1567108 RepID=A0ABW2DRD5_9BACT|nr:hypothetical protein [Rufibacter roseus]
MDTAVKKKVAGKPIEDLLKNNTFLPSGDSYLQESLQRLQQLRQAYMISPAGKKSVFRLPKLQKK